ncbi:class I SAM-dependent methyltransferase [Undibacterium piscinae]|uniref:Class I SAM-dependent methyltransferase n=1 Tax=Undibacterium piscinae TaxID=2495591 RepID=A0A6M4A0A2_9BURK|nr:class I SAM-dependent methyltransferase [Undibacterium piscinae]
MSHLSTSSASAWVRRFVPLITQKQGPVLDLACGGGRHTRLLLEAGHEVWALDRDASLLAPLEAQGVRCFQFDLESKPAANGLPEENVNWPFEAGQFSAIIVTNYLHRPLLPMLINSLMDQGLLIYETFAVGNEVFGRPKNPDFLLRPGELLREFLPESEAGKSRHCIAYEHGYVDQPYPAMVQRICVRAKISANPGIDRLDAA